MKILRWFAVSLSACCPFWADAGLVITRVAGPPTSQVRVSQPNFDNGGNTSIRYYERHDRDLKYDTVLKKNYYNRDRDLGQTFRTGAQGYKLDAITLRTGFGTLPFRAGSAGAEMYLQIFRVAGTPVINHHGTTSNPPGARWQTFAPTDPETDDYIDGETFTSILVVRGATMPDLSQFKSVSSGAPGNGQYLRWDLTGGDEILLEANTTYAFMVGFVEPAAERALSLANNFRGNYAGGHGIRREGSPDTPAFYNPALVTPYTEAMFVSDTNNAADNDAALDKASFAPDFNVRTSDMTFGTMGMPDVCTFRDLTFWIEGVAAGAGASNPSARPFASVDQVPPQSGVVVEGVTDNGTTSVRWRSSAEDTDMGAVFMIPANANNADLLDTITLRIASANFGANVPGMPVILDFFEVAEGPVFFPLWRQSGNLPTNTAPDDYVTFNLSRRQQTLTPGASYAFLIGANIEDLSDTETNRFRIYTSASDQRPDTYEIRREWEFGPSRPAPEEPPNDVRLTRDVLFYITSRSAAPVLVAPARDQNTFTVSVETLTNRTYYLEYTDSLITADWTTLNPVLGTGAREELRDTTAAAGNRYYRARMQ